jgi:hypothetical protein
MSYWPRPEPAEAFGFFVVPVRETAIITATTATTTPAPAKAL